MGRRILLQAAPLIIESQAAPFLRFFILSPKTDCRPQPFPAKKTERIKSVFEERMAKLLPLQSEWGLSYSSEGESVGDLAGPGAV